ncbi:sigma-70 family RNA polymerase sigma factor [Streptomyces sp. NPDC002577]
MPDGPATVPTPASASASATAAYTRVYEEEQPRLVAYARSLTGSPWAAEDLVAEAHFRVWRRLSGGHEIDNVPAYLMTTVRHLATTAGSAARETPQDPWAAERVEAVVHGDDPAEQVSSVDLLVRVLGQLPERWVKALWLAEAEDQPLEAIGPRIGTKQGATAVLLHRAREGMRQAFLRSHPGAPNDPSCEAYWVRMPAYVRGAATPRQSGQLLGHTDGCDDCRHRLAELMRANDRLPALVGPALLVFVLGGAGKFLLPLATGSVGAVVPSGGHGGGLLSSGRHAVGSGAKVKAAVAVGVAVAGAAVVAGIALGSVDSSPVPLERVPLAEAPVVQPSQDASAEQHEERGAPVGAAETPESEQVWTDDGTVPAAGVVRGTDTTVVQAKDADEPTSAPGESATKGPGDDSPSPGEAAPGSTGSASAPAEPVEEEPEPGAPSHEPEPPASEAPGTDAPGTAAPEDDAPETETPDTEAPETEAPKTGSPEAETPDTEAPKTETPGAEAPGTQAPEDRPPATQTPHTEAPETPNPGEGCGG